MRTTFLLLLLTVAGAVSRGAELPANLDVRPLRDLPTQHDGRWPPLDTVARDYVESITGAETLQGRDPLVVLLAWTFALEDWQSAPLIPIRNAALRAALELPADRMDFSYDELRAHDPLMQRIAALGGQARGRKPDALESKVGDIAEKLGLLRSALAGDGLALVPNTVDARSPWGLPNDADAPAEVAQAWRNLGLAVRSDNAAAFAAATDQLRAALAAQPAAWRPSARILGLEVRFNALRPFRKAWQIMAAGVVCAVLALATRRKAWHAASVLLLAGGLGVLTYGLACRWQIVGRIPAANMFESLLFLSWGAGIFGLLALLLVRDRLVPLTASAVGALALFLADVLPVDHFIRPIPPVLADTIWMSIHVPVIMVAYAVLALAMLIAHAQLITLAVQPRGGRLSERIDRLHYWYIHVGMILLGIGIATGSMWAASSWGRYWGWDPKEVWSLVAFLAYLAIMHVRVDRQRLPGWVYAAGAALGICVLIICGRLLAARGDAPPALLIGAGAIVAVFVATNGTFATATKSVLAFWAIIMTYLGVNYVLGIGLHSYGFGTGAMVRAMATCAGADAALVALCAVAYLARRPRRGAAGAELPLPDRISGQIHGRVDYFMPGALSVADAIGQMLAASAAGRLLMRNATGSMAMTLLAVAGFIGWGCSTTPEPSASPTPTPSPSPAPVGGDSLLYLLQPEEIPAAEIAASGFAWVVIEPSRFGDAASEFTAAEVDTLQGGGPCGESIVLAYLSIGEAEDYRDYWDEQWVAGDEGPPVAGVAPDWLGSNNPDWPGNYKVRYWDADWQALILGTPAGDAATPLDRIIDAGFDGVYLDIVDAFEYWSEPEGGAELTRAEARARMIAWVQTIAAYARTTRGATGFLVFPQNAAEIILDDDGELDDLSEQYFDAVSGIGIEDFYYDETTPNDADDVASRLALLAEFRDRGKLVLVTDYVLDAGLTPGVSGDRVDDFLRRARAEGFIPYAAIADRDLDEIVVLPADDWPMAQPAPCGN